MQIRFPLVDLQVNGGWGVGFADPDATLAQMRACCEQIFARGTTAFLATLVSSPPEVYKRNLPMLARLAREPAMHGRLLGIHLEGPFLAADERVLGAHRAEHVSDGGLAHLGELIDLCDGSLRMLTVSVQTPDAGRIINTAARLGIAVSIGHSFFSEAELTAAAAKGARALTHLGNALPATLDKRDNPFYAGLLSDELTACFIADDHHLSRAMLRLLFRCKSRDRLIAVSDAAPVAGLPAGSYRVFGQDAVLEPTGRLVNLEENHLVGSSTDLLAGLNTLLRSGVCSPDDCAAIGSANPLALLGVPTAELAADRANVTYDAELDELRSVTR